MQLLNLLKPLVLINTIGSNVQAMTLILYGGSADPTRAFRIDEVTQRCYNIHSCFGGPNKSATWNGVKRHTNVIFYSNANCQTHQAIGKGAPDGVLYFSDAKFVQNVAAFMIWETGQYAISGIEDACYLDEKTRINATDA